jgi:hypothetical protein
MLHKLRRAPTNLPRLHWIDRAKHVGTSAEPLTENNKGSACPTPNPAMFQNYPALVGNPGRREVLYCSVQSITCHVDSVVACTQPCACSSAISKCNRRDDSTSQVPENAVIVKVESSGKADRLGLGGFPRQSADRGGRGRDTSCLVPPARIRTCAH